MSRFNDLLARVRKGEVFSRAQALEVIGITDEKKVTISYLDRPAVQEQLYGKVTINDDLTKMTDDLDHTTIAVIPFKARKEQITLSGVYVNTFESGYDFSVVLVLKDDMIRDADQIGITSINRTTKSIIWNPASAGDRAGDALISSGF